jgi:hypothetical protein
MPHPKGNEKPLKPQRPLRPPPLAVLPKTTAYVQSTRARDLMKRHRTDFARNQIKIPSPGDYPGEEYLHAFEETLRSLARWLEESA